MCLSGAVRQLAFSVKVQTVNILDFAGHKVS